MFPIFCVAVFPILCVVLIFVNILHFKRKLWKKRNNNVVSVGFFHPYCNAGGGGERVLWAAIDAMQKKYKNIHCIVYSGDSVSAESILTTVEQRFNIKLTKEIEIVFLRNRFLVEAKYYPFCTLLMQSIGSIVLGLEAIWKHVPDIYIDTMGYAWTLPIFKFLGASRVGAYIHFPTISTDMLQVVQSRSIAVNNRKFITNSRIFSYLKLLYYKIFAYFYGVVGARAEVIMVNSSWTRGHILELWNKPQRTFTVYPPCDVSEFNSIPLEIHDNKSRILSIAQFRPEKNHELQIRAFYDFIQKLDHAPHIPVLVLIGSCRHEEDHQRVERLKDLCIELGISKQVEFKINISFQDILCEMENASVALHTMKDEHFGIGIVECMSAGLVMIAHNSGGPKMDIVVDYYSKPTGFLATDVKTFADALETVWKMDSKDVREIRNNARKSVSRFSAQKFEDSFLPCIKLLFI